MHVRWWQSVSVPGQVDAVTQTTQAPWPSQMVLPPQLLPAVTNGLLGDTRRADVLRARVAVDGQVEVVVGGRGRALAVADVLLAVARRLRRRPACRAAVLLVPHWPATQLRVWHSASVPGQVLADRHSTQWEAPSHTQAAAAGRAGRDRAV